MEQRINQFNKHDLLVLLLTLVISIFFCLWNLGSRPIGAHSDEAIHGAVAYHMYQSGDYLHPNYKKTLYLAKPPLKIWLTALGLKVFGNSSFVYRMWDGIGGVALAVTVFFFARAIFCSTLAGFLSALLIFTSKTLLFAHVIRIGTQDSLVVFLSTLAFFKLWQAYQVSSSEKLTKKEIICRGLVIGSIIGCGFLIKSIAALFPYVITSIFFVITTILSKKINYSLLSIIIVAGFVTILFGASWYVPHLLSGHLSILTLFEYDRFNVGYHHSTSKFFYLENILSGRAGSLILIILSTIWLIYSWLKDKTETIYLFLLAWAYGILLIVSCLNSRLEHYLAPAIPAFIIASGGFLNWLYTKYCSSKKYSVFARLSLILIILACMVEPSCKLFRNAKKIYSAQGTDKVRYENIYRIINRDFDKSASIMILQPPNRKKNLSAAEYLYFEMIKRPQTISFDSDAVINHLNSSDTRIVLAEDSQGLELVKKLPDLPCIKYRIPKNHAWREWGFLITNKKPDSWSAPKNRCIELKASVNM